MLEGTGEGREISTTQAFVRFLTALLRDKELGQRVVPIVPDEARTFGMEGLFRQLGIYTPEGQMYTPVDKDQVMYYREDKAGQILQEGINEAGGMCSLDRGGDLVLRRTTASMIPFYIYYSMFGFQRIGDLAWAAGDMQARGFLLGGTAGRTTLNGEGLQHEDGHSHILARPIPNCVSYDPTFGYEVAVILHDGLRRMVGEQENVFYYLTLMNENYAHPAIPKGRRGGHPQGHVPAARGRRRRRSRACSCWAAARSCAKSIAAAELLEKDWGVAADVWSAQLHRAAARRPGLRALEPAASGRQSRARPTSTQMLASARPGPVIAATDYMKTYAEQIRAFVPKGARTACWAPTASGAATSAPSCASSSRSTATTSWSRR